ncbi:MAG: ATP-binding protein [Pseudomonadota bacterium]|nr:ATP-binding protein [Pseudomonadota bacterium]
MPLALLGACAAGYLGLLFAVARVAERREAAGKSIVANAWVYALSTCIYATGWAYFGQPGAAARQGIGFLAVDIFTAVALVLAWPALRKLVRVARAERLVSLADVLGRRYGRRGDLAALVVVVALVCTVPYVALQFAALAGGVVALAPDAGSYPAVSLVVALVLAFFAALFGTRHPDVSERHPGIVAAIAFEACVKLVGLLAAAVFVVWGLFGGPLDLLREAPPPEALRTLDGEMFGFAVTGLTGGLAFYLLPRMFQVLVVENVDERHIRRMPWFVGGYLMLLDLASIAIALGGLHVFAASVPADAYVVALPARFGPTWLTLLVFIGGVSAATAMVLVESVAVATMVTNALVFPLLMRGRGGAAIGEARVLWVRRAALLAFVLVSWGFLQVVGRVVPIAALGLVAFGAIAQLAPALVGALYWRGATARGVMVGLAAGMLVWAWTLLVPTLADAGVLSAGLVVDGPWGIAAFRPEHLFGLTGLPRDAHGLLFSLGANVLAFAATSLSRPPSLAEAVQAEVFVSGSAPTLAAPAPREGLTLGQAADVLARLLGGEAAWAAVAENASGDGRRVTQDAPATATDLGFIEARLSGTLGGTVAGTVVSGLLSDEPLRLRMVRTLLDTSTQVVIERREHEGQVRDLEDALAKIERLYRIVEDKNQALAEANTELEAYAFAVSHDLRAPLRAIQGFGALLADRAGERLSADDKALLGRVNAAASRMTEYVNGLLALSRAGRAPLACRRVDLTAAAAEILAELQATSPGRAVEVTLEPGLVAEGDPVLLNIVLQNLLGNAWKFTGGAEVARIAVGRRPEDGALYVRDNGAGFDAADASRLFHPFVRLHSQEQFEGTGIGLATVDRIVRRHGGRVWAEAKIGEGATFWFTLGAPPPAR